jgi:hypothetical protein
MQTNEGLRMDLWTEDPEWPMSDWKAEVANSETLRGYWAWVEAQREWAEHAQVEAEPMAFGVRRGDRIRLVSMGSDPDPIPSGSEGEVTGWNDGGDSRFHQVWVKWDSGRSLNLIPGADRWEVIR